MPLSNEVARSLQYLRKQYGVSERDLVSLAKRLQSTEGGPEEQSWEDLTRDYLRKKRSLLTR